MRKIQALLLVPLMLMAQQGTPNRDYAGLRADLDSLREQQKLLYAEILALRQELEQRDAAVKKAIRLVDDLDRRVTDNDAAWKKQVAEIMRILDTEHEARVKATARLQQELKNRQHSAAAGTGVQAGGEYAVISIVKGDTLGAIAKAAGITPAELRKINNLKSDTIYEGQKLKVPVPKEK